MFIPMMKPPSVKHLIVKQKVAVKEIAKTSNMATNVNSKYDMGIPSFPLLAMTKGIIRTI
uniref:Uncharacterized protein n=1 Tax=Lepeophtheirus salmonis TaxID=72036 RepID=A0A0K2TH25_LEPSM